MNFLFVFNYDLLFSNNKLCYSTLPNVNNMIKIK